MGESEIFARIHVLESQRGVEDGKYLRQNFDEGARHNCDPNGSARDKSGMSVESAFTDSSHTWLHVLSRSTSRETIWEMPVEFLALELMHTWRNYGKREQVHKPRIASSRL